MNSHTKRRKRRRAKLLLKNKKAVRPHRRVGGRTGDVRWCAKKLVLKMKSLMNPPFSGWGTR